MKRGGKEEGWHLGHHVDREGKGKGRRRRRRRQWLTRSRIRRPIDEPVSAFHRHAPCTHPTRLTESTRSRDVFPAFCSPTIVTSISVALLLRGLVSSGFRDGDSSGGMRPELARSPAGNSGAPLHVVGLVRYSPKGPEQPVV